MKCSSPKNESALKLVLLYIYKVAPTFLDMSGFAILGVGCAFWLKHHVLYYTAFEGLDQLDQQQTPPNTVLL